MQRSSCAEILTRLCEGASTRPALLEKISTMGRRRTIFRLLGKETGSAQPSGGAGRFGGGPDADADEANRPASPDGSTDEMGEGDSEPSGRTGRFNRLAEPDGSGQPSGVTGRLGRGANRPAAQDGSALQEPSTVGEPSANRPAGPDTPLTLNPTTSLDSPSEGGTGGDASQQAAPPAKTNSARGHRIPADWVPSVAKRTTLREKYDRPNDWWLDETEAFRNHFLASTGRNASKTNWDLAFHNWIKEAIRREGGPNGGRRWAPNGSPSGSKADDAIKDMAARAAAIKAAKQTANGNTQPQLAIEGSS
jgi:hypothetical protein